ncbi:MAG: S8 family serine peptidase [Blastocatellia bacterium]
MARNLLRITPIAIFVLALMFAGKFAAHSDSTAQQANHLKYDSSYRSSSSTHKVIIQANEPELRESILAEGGSVIEDYGSFVLMSAPRSAADRIGAMSAAGSSVRDDMNVLLLRAGAVDTTGDAAVAASYLGEPDFADKQLYLVQLVGPIKKHWTNQLRSSVEIVSYIPNNAYLVRADAAAIARIKGFKSQPQGFVQWIGSFKPDYKIAPEISLDSDDEIISTIQLASSVRTPEEIQQLIARASASVIGEPTTVLNYTDVRIKVRSSRLADIARMSNVVWIERWTPPVVHDEKQGLIVAGKLTGSEHSASSYLAWLQSKGLASTPDFIVDVADSGIDQGSLDPEVLHKDFLNSAGLARISYARYVGAFEQDALPQDSPGHGTINASIVGGYNTGSSFPYVDSDGYKFGLGIHPYALLGVTQIFAPEYTNPNLASMVEKMYRDGARISSNSWGAYDNTYTVDCQTYDSLVRDAQPAVQANQQMTILFSSGNKGPGGHLTSPGNAKNVIMVGASENLREGVDGCAIDSAGADDINSLIGFSSGGPTVDGRVRPDLVAPGTHIQGARSQSRGYNGGGVCGPGNYPGGQSLYTWSSGTSHAAPAVAGAAALIRQLFQQSVGHPPSPAMLKCYLTNSTSYMTGLLAGDALPGNNQGWGLLSLGRALDGIPRITVDQDQNLASTGQTVVVNGRVADPSKPFRVTLAWTDAPGSPAASPTVNDLDLQVEVGGKTYLGNQFSGGVSIEGGSADNRNNLEGVWAPGGSSGDFTVRIVAANIAGDGVPGNGDLTDQDFALVIYNAQSQDGGGGGPVDLPPVASLMSPAGGERFTVGNTIRIQWTATDDKGLQNQKVEFSPDGISFSPIATLDGKARTFDWRVPGWPTSSARIRISVLDGVNLPVTSMNAAPFEIVNGPPDTTPPSVTLLSHNGTDPVGGGLTTSIKWRETDNVGVLRRLIELSTDNGNTFQQIVSLEAVSSGDTQTYNWLVPADMVTGKSRVRVTIYDGAGNSSTATSRENFDIWPMPIINGATVTEGDRISIELAGRNFRIGETEIWVDGVQLRKLQYIDRYFTGNGTYKRVTSVDKKLHKRVPDRTWVTLEIRLPRTGQISPSFEFRRKKPLS